MSYAVACITLFGLMTLFVYPFFSHWLFGADPRQVGLFLGTAVHDTSQTRIEGIASVEHGEIVPHEQVAHLPLMTHGETLLGGVRPQRIK